MQTSYTRAQIELAKEAQAHLTAISSVATRILSATKDPKIAIHTNIKSLMRGATKSEVAYAVLGRSENSDSARVMLDENLSSRRLIDHVFYNSIAVSHGQRDHVHACDFEKELAKWGEIMRFVQPDKEWIKLCKSCLIVAIQGPKSALLEDSIPDDRAFHPFGEEGILLGFICADAQEYNVFDEHGDLNVMRALARKAFNTFRVHYAAHHAARISGLSAVS